MPVFAKKVDLETAKKAAKNIFYTRVNQFKVVSLSSINLTLAYTEIVNNEPVYYAFNVNNNEGFVVISANDIVRPCIGYSYEGPYVTNNQAPSFQYWMGEYRNQIAVAVASKAPQSPEAAQEWAALLVNNPALVKTQAGMPLLIHTWNQDWPYNELCPVDAAGPGGHVYVGCVATSMAQVMKYWNYPDVGTGSHTNYNLTNGGYGNLTVNYGAQTYVWENMTNTINGTNYEIAKLGYHCSVAVDMAYAPDGSGSQTSKIATALETYYKYSTDAVFKSKSSYTASAWEALLIGQIDNKWPMSYSGSGSGGGHAWNCDGYQTGTPTLFHMNWGWGGSSNGFFDVADLSNAGGYDFNSSQGAVINIYPTANYPEGCTSTAKVISGAAGTFNDGSGNTNYSNNKDCSYLIQPACASVVNLTFDRFDLGTGDNVYIYGGTSTSDPLLATYNSTTLPTTAVTSYAGAMLIRFVTDASNNATGWYASYTTFPCQGTRYITENSGNVTDGSLSCDYGTSLACTWWIQPANATSYRLTFPEFLMAADAGDKLLVYKNTLSSSNLIATYSSTNLPPAQLDVIGTKVGLKFSSNSTVTAAGWSVNYNVMSTGIENNLSEFDASIFPNPFNNDATVSYSLNNPTNVKITVTNVLGKVIGTYEQANAQGNNNLQLSSFVNEISQGIYFVNLSFNDKSTLIKIVCTK